MSASQTVSIQPLGFAAPVAAAARELAVYLPKLAPVRTKVLKPAPCLARKCTATIVIGTSDHLAGLKLGRLPAMSDLDDAFALVPHGNRLVIAGANSRSVLFGAYRLLEELGAVFLRPGPNGEVLARRDSLELPQRPIREAASYRHRGICIEGSPRLDHVLDQLRWMAKKKMNTYQLQFRHAGVFWRRGYGETDGHALTEDDCYALDERVIQLCNELGMIVHRVGHGWTAFTLGLPGFCWERNDLRPDPDKADWLAEVNGERAVWARTPVNTELCYGRADVRDAVVSEVLSYARRHSEVDVVHVWLSDALNNKCECELCATRPATDWYVMMVNDIGARLRAEGLATRVVFLAYVDLLWPPQTQRVTEDNVILMYAPITRCFRHALADAECAEDFDPARPVLNSYTMPLRNRSFVEIAEMWRQQELPDTFLFDYHMMWAVWRDGFGMDIGRVMAQDMKSLVDLGLNGMVSCQCTRAYYPLPWMPNVMADLLWDKGLAVGKHRKKTMDAAFGAYAGEAETYFSAVVQAFKCGPEHDHQTIADTHVASRRRKLTALAQLAERCQTRFSDAARAENDPVVSTSLDLLAVHAEHAVLIAGLHQAVADGDQTRIERIQEAYGKRLKTILQEFAPWIDPHIAGPIREISAATPE